MPFTDRPTRNPGYSVGVRPAPLFLLVLLSFALGCDKSGGGDAPVPSSTAAPVPTPVPSPTLVTSALPTATATATATANATATAMASASASAPVKHDAGASATGDGGVGERPLQSWMKANMTPAFATKDLPTVADLLDKVAAAPPPKYTRWASIAKDGAAAARAGDYNATKASCRGCHDQYKAKYIAENRARPFP